MSDVERPRPCPCGLSLLATEHPEGWCDAGQRNYEEARAEALRFARAFASPMRRVNEALAKADERER